MVEKHQISSFARECLHFAPKPVVYKKWAAYDHRICLARMALKRLQFALVGRLILRVGGFYCLLGDLKHVIRDHPNEMFYGIPEVGVKREKS